MKNYYAILGVSPTANELEIKKAFRKLAIRYHPDKNPSQDAKHRFQEIIEAYDVLGNAVKRAAYDAKLANPLAEIFGEPVRQHRDPAYRRRPPSPRTPKEPPASWLIMRDSLKYVIWISRIGLVFTTLFFVDFFLPYRQIDDSIEKIRVVRSSRTDAYHIINTGSGHEIKVYEFRAGDFEDHRRIHLLVTRIFGSVMSVSNSSGTFKAWVAYMYSSLIFFPIGVFVSSLLALIYRKKVEFCFNLNLATLMLLVITLILF